VEPVPSEISDDLVWRQEVKIVSRPGSVLLVRHVLPLFSLTDDGDPNVFLSCFSGEILICNLAYHVHVYRTALGPVIIMSFFLHGTIVMFEPRFVLGRCC
jgi:hypothetical protein